MRIIRNIQLFILNSNYPGTSLIRRVYYYIRYIIVRGKILAYCKWYDYPASQIFLTITLNNLQYTEFNEKGHRDISSRNVYKIIGKVIDGDWDLNRTSIEEWPIYISLKKYFIENVDLKETPYYKDRVESERDRSIWISVNKKKYLKEVKRNTRIYHTLKVHGYKTQRELGNPDILDEVRVKIARDGTFLWENSIHRFIIAKLLDIEEIPVVVTVRHFEWVRLKQKLIAAARMNRDAGKNETEKKYIHPDLRDIPCSPDGERILNDHVQLHENREHLKNLLTIDG